MLQFPCQKPIRSIFTLSLLASTIFAVSCSGPAVPPIEHTYSSASNEQVSDLPEPVRKISVGQQLRFEHISLDQGLSQSTVFCILQTYFFCSIVLLSFLTRPWISNRSRQQMIFTSLVFLTWTCIRIYLGYMRVISIFSNLWIKDPKIFQLFIIFFAPHSSE